ncbi:tRNA preQ1(34) S-adenosylmethionine ribosyltransferase-isomerase QueA [Litorivicinus lipolyticus]|uniref:tRNA preQ1(34) S-adenosylmethionine ribosyltransferase-isomerase QueA n=1 Tax=Litorivicinus lipolyticus TaxID=418701 RepID=UPI003B5B517A
MQKSDFHFELPEAQIAAEPLADRSASRLLHLNDAGIAHRQFTDLVSQLEPNDLLVLNNTRVLPARLFATKSTGGKAEVMLERRLANGDWRAFVKSSKTPKPGATLTVADGFTIDLLARDGDLFVIRLCGDDPMGQLQTHGHMPLPPYIKRADTEADRARYQTVFAKNEGAVAAPTAGLHFTPELLNAIRARGVDTAEVTLHVGAGTFLPMREDDVKKHVMHSEWFECPAVTADKINATRARGGRVIAVGTTVVRTLESVAAQTGSIQAHAGDTSIFIYPGFKWQVIDAMVTNFHLPESTLLMLVSAFAGTDAVLAAYNEAVAEGYRFFSYGDAMLLERAGG